MKLFDTPTDKLKPIDTHNLNQDYENFNLVRAHGILSESIILDDDVTCINRAIQKLDDSVLNTMEKDLLFLINEKLEMIDLSFKKSILKSTAQINLKTDIFPFEQLPSEIRRTILSYISFEDRLKLKTTVSKEFKNDLEHSPLLEHFIYLKKIKSYLQITPDQSIHNLKIELMKIPESFKIEVTHRREMHAYVKLTNRDNDESLRYRDHTTISGRCLMVLKAFFFISLFLGFCILLMTLPYRLDICKDENEQIYNHCHISSAIFLFLTGLISVLAIFKNIFGDPMAARSSSLSINSFFMALSPIEPIPKESEIGSLLIKKHN
jgi:hypothetical protein